MGKGNALGTVRAILFHVRHDAACPECRTPGVFVLAHELHQTDQLVRRRCAPWPRASCVASAGCVIRTGRLVLHSRPADARRGSASSGSFSYRAQLLLVLCHTACSAPSWVLCMGCLGSGDVQARKRNTAAGAGVSVLVSAAGLRRSAQPHRCASLSSRSCAPSMRVRAGAPRGAAPPRRWPEEHAKRAKEMQAKEARLRAILAQQRAERVQENSFRPSF